MPPRNPHIYVDQLRRRLESERAIEVNQSVLTNGREPEPEKEEEADDPEDE